MSLEKIIERIEQDAKNQVDEIKKNASLAADKIIQEAREKAESLKAQALEDAHKQADIHKQRIISSANLEFRKEILAEKQRDIDAAFQEAVDILLNMKNDEYRKAIINMILPNVQTGNEEVILSERDKTRLGGNFIKDINNQLTRNGKKGHLKLSQDTYNMLGGFVLRRGNIELNNSFESLFKSFRDDLEAEVSRILFPTG